VTSDFVDQRFNIVFGIPRRTASGNCGANGVERAVGSIHTIDPEGFPEELADVAVLFFGDGDNLLGQLLGEADGEDARGSFWGRVHVSIMTKYDNFVQLDSESRDLVI
jgi:hypothetical protein